VAAVDALGNDDRVVKKGPVREAGERVMEREVLVCRMKRA
jgi:hypothetical protein